MLSSEHETDNTESFYQSLATAQQKNFFQIKEKLAT